MNKDCPVCGQPTEIEVEPSDVSERLNADQANNW